jgi:hypothetical protein
MLSAVAPKSQEIALTLGLVVATPYTELDSVNVQVFYDMVNVHGQERAGLGICYLLGRQSYAICTIHGL